MYLHHVQRGKQPIHTLKKPPKMVGFILRLELLSDRHDIETNVLLTLNCLLTAAVHQVGGLVPASSSLVEPTYVIRRDSLSVPRNSFSNAVLSPWTCNSAPTATMSHMSKGLFLFLDVERHRFHFSFIFWFLSLG